MPWHCGQYPTFTVPDLRLIVYIMTRQFRRRTAEAFSSGSWYSQRPGARRRPSPGLPWDSTSHAIAISSPDSPPDMDPDSSSVAVSDDAEGEPSTRKSTKRSSFNKKTASESVALVWEKARSCSGQVYCMVIPTEGTGLSACSWHIEQSVREVPSGGWYEYGGDETVARL